MNRCIIIAPTVSHGISRVVESVTKSAAQPEDELYVVKVSPGQDIAHVTRETLKGRTCDRVIAVGGDGTVSAVASAIIHSETSLGIVPAGTGNLVARDLSIPLDVAEATALAVSSTASLRRIDIMHVNNRVCLLNAGIGINAETTSCTSRLEKTLLGRSAYVSTAVRKVIMAKSKVYHITCDDTPLTCEAVDVLVSNCGNLAYTLHPKCPAIQPDDGRLDLHIAEMRLPIEYPWYYLRRWLFPNRIYREVREIAAYHRVTITTDHPMSIQADGDIIGTTPLTVEIDPSALAIAVPHVRP